MAVRLKRLNEQVIVITGASSGIGLTTAKMAAARGARVVLSSRDEVDLRRAVDEIRRDGGDAIFVRADVADLEATENIARAVIREFGGFDTWINNAGLSIYGLIEEVPIADARRLFDVNYWGVVYGSLVALPHLKEYGGALINIGSVVSDRAIPLQGHYSASKHAVKAFTDALRMEVAKERAPVSVTLVKPTSIDTPFPEHARNYMEAEPTHPSPVYTPEVVAEAILFCAEHARRDVVVGGGGKMATSLEAMPRIADRYMEVMMFEQQKTDEPTRPDRVDTLFEPHAGDGRERGNFLGRVRKSSIYTKATLHPMATLAGVAALGAGLVFASRRPRD
jgi:short-subunit dehydrogenase